MKAWVLEDHDNGGITLYSEHTNVLDIPFVRIELSYLSDGYEDERKDFLADIDYAIHRGHGSAGIEERLTLTLQEVSVSYV